jgi:hypothetical protein
VVNAHVGSDPLYSVERLRSENNAVILFFREYNAVILTC